MIRRMCTIRPGFYANAWPRALNATSPSRLFKEDINVLYDGKCSLCLFEINMLARMDSKGRIRFTDIEDSDVDLSKPENGHISYEKALANIHAVRYNGDILVGLPVFKAMYSAVGLGSLFYFTKYDFLKRIADRMYALFAKYRPIVSRGKNIDALVIERNKTISQKIEQQQEDDWSVNVVCCDDRCSKIRDLRMTN